ncbi:hypothetical protein MMC28_000092 [Mycoblastus sanguinarius]|nr:hypothetical protein [Mycoblastus sanguinarius]
MYARRDIVVNHTPELKRASLTKINEPLFSEPQIIDLTNDFQVDLKHCTKPIVLDVPAFSEEPIDASHVIFGMATKLDRLESSIIFLQRWIAYTHARLLVVAVSPDEGPPDSKRMRSLERHMRNLGIDVTIVKPLHKDDNMAQRYFSLARLMYRTRDSRTQWISFVDDDTFFPSIHSLISVLDTYDPQEHWYLGGMSEEWWSVVRYGFMGFGGAGIFLSVPLAAIINANYESCEERSGAGAGDMKIRECIAWHTNTKLTHIRGLHQIDMHGDRSGLFESGRLLLSLHHWKAGWWDESGYGAGFPMSAMHQVADVCGDCFLQRWQFGTDTILSNGYSIAEYPKGRLSGYKNDTDLDRVENTWLPAGIVTNSSNPGWDHYLGPLRPKMKLEEEKVQYRFLDSLAVDGGVRQLYLHTGIDREPDTVVELFWIQKKRIETSSLEIPRERSAIDPT